MTIEIVPSEVLRSAGVLADAAQPGGTAPPPGSGNSGFDLSGAIEKFAATMEQGTTRGAQEMSLAAQKLEISAQRLRRRDDEGAAGLGQLWRRGE